MDEVKTAKKFTVELEPDLHRRFKLAAIRTNHSMREAVVGLIEAWTAREEKREQERREDERIRSGGTGASGDTA